MDKILYHGTFLTMDESRTEPEAVLIRDGMIGGTGTLEEMKALAPDGALWDMEGHTVLPGFIDGHSHLSAVAYQLLIANLKPSPLGTCDSVEDVVQVLKTFLETHSLKPGQWLLGMGYDNSVFPEGVHPTKEDLDRVSTEIPVAATHVSGHLCVVNTKGLELWGTREIISQFPRAESWNPQGF
ncbi:amidohydrolase family protein [Hungatella sp.]|uniref:amidohydrolase family protein n=1 Tax=Hungatella sp. TaxID=2613924 RepID=UPI003994B1CE